MEPQKLKTNVAKLRFDMKNNLWLKVKFFVPTGIWFVFLNMRFSALRNPMIIFLSVPNPLSLLFLPLIYILNAVFFSFTYFIDGLIVSHLILFYFLNSCTNYVHFRFSFLVIYFLKCNWSLGKTPTLRNWFTES